MLIRNKQLFGISRDLLREMTERQYTTEKGLSMRIRVETKTDMKSRIGKSPDISDAAFILIELCRVRHNLTAVDRIPDNPYQQNPGYQKWFKKVDLNKKAGKTLNYGY